MSHTTVYESGSIEELRARADSLEEDNMRLEGELNYYRNKCTTQELEVQKLTKIVRAVEVLCGGKILDR